MQEMWVQSLGWEDPLEEEMATHSSILAWNILWSCNNSLWGCKVGHAEHVHPICTMTMLVSRNTVMRILNPQVIKNPPANTRDVWDAVLIPESGRSPGGEHGNSLQYSCLDYPMDKGSWWATINRVAKSQTQLKWLSAFTKSMQFIR